MPKIRRLTITQAIEQAVRESRKKFGGRQIDIAAARHLLKLFRAFLGQYTGQFVTNDPVRVMFIRKLIEECETQAIELGLFKQPAKPEHKKKMRK